MHLVEGTILAGKYRTARVLGQGGMGIVVAAEHVQLEQKVAIKLLLPEILSNQEVVQRFLREARASARIQSEHVVRVFDVGTLETGEPYMAMEFLDGKDLGDVVRERGRLSPREAVDYVLEACEALAEAHQLGIIHRDLKPSNLFLARRSDGSELVKVLDFGISKTSAPDEGGMTRTSALLGSPLYMSPEQLTSSRNVDARSDIWALGIVLYELLTGRPPFVEDTLPQVIALVMHQPAPSLQDLAPEVPLALSDVVLRCLAKQPEGRFAHLGELSTALAPFATPGHTSLDRIARRFGTARPSLSPSVSRSGVGAVSVNDNTSLSETKGTWGGTLHEGRKRRNVGLWLGVAAGGAALCGGLTVLLLGSGSEPSAAGSPSAETAPSISALATSPTPEPDKAAAPEAESLAPPTPEAAAAPAPTAPPAPATAATSTPARSTKTSSKPAPAQFAPASTAAPPATPQAAPTPKPATTPSAPTTPARRSRL